MALLQERTVLAALHIGLWSGMAIDEEVNFEVAESHQAEVNAGNYRKRLVSSKHMKNIRQKASVLSRAHRLLTLPWEDGGVRILSTRSYFSYTEQMRLAGHGFMAVKQQFMKELPAYIEDQKLHVLGSMFRHEDYPEPEVIAKKFWFDIEIKPTPSANDFRAELSDDTVKAIVSDIEKRTDQRLEQAMNDVFERVADVTSRMVERLRAYSVNKIGAVENGFKDSLVGNIRELAELLPSLNITGDKRLDDLQQTLLTDLTQHAPDALRGDEKLRNHTADKAEEILKKVKKFMV